MDHAVHAQIYAKNTLLRTTRIFTETRYQAKITCLTEMVVTKMANLESKGRNEKSENEKAIFLQIINLKHAYVSVDDAK